LAGAFKVDDVQIRNRLHSACIDAEDIRTLKGVWREIEGRLPGYLNGFYVHVRQEPALDTLIGERETQLKSAQIGHWRSLFLNGFDQAYFDNALRIGGTHHRIGLEPKWYIAGYSYLFNEIVDHLIRRYRFSPAAQSAAIRATTKAVFMDLDIALSTYQEASEQALVERSRTTEAAITQFQREFDTVIGGFRDSAGDLKATSTSLDGTVQTTQTSADSVASAASTTSADSTSVAAASEELTKSIQEISHQISGASQSIREIVGLTEASGGEVAQLSGAVGRIGEILSLIHGIAAQTNLLALNATIEAARAGDAGKGFAVVASEVKQLATETARATTEISRHIQEIQSSTERAVTSNRAILSAVHQVEQMTTSVAAAVEEQSTATNEIAVRVQHVSQSASIVAENVGELNEAVTRTHTASDQVGGAARRLDSQSAELEHSVKAFFTRLRA
jgi:methyl-accepting chemotaxis protein